MKYELMQMQPVWLARVLLANDSAPVDGKQRFEYRIDQQGEREPGGDS